MKHLTPEEIVFAVQKMSDNGQIDLDKACEETYTAEEVVEYWEAEHGE